MHFLPLHNVGPCLNNNFMVENNIVWGEGVKFVFYQYLCIESLKSFGQDCSLSQTLTVNWKPDISTL